MVTHTTFNRDLNLRRLATEHFDVLVVGGGITGAGVALDAACRGLKVALVERHDWASGTSSKSSKLVHGGLRYLNQREYRLVHEALHERQRLRANAPHLVRPLPFLIPLFGRDGLIDPRLAKAVNGVLWLYDLTGGWRIGRLHRRIGLSEVLENMPALRPERVQGGFIYHDARTDDARLTLAVVRTAAHHGAVTANHCEVVAVEGDHITLRPTSSPVGSGASPGDVPAEDVPGEFVSRASLVVNACGVWADSLEALAEAGKANTTRTSTTHVRTLRPAKGVHLSVPRSRLPSEIAAVLPVSGTKRSVFVIPMGAHTYIGTTDTDYEGPLDEPLCTAEEVDELLGAVNTWVSDPLARNDVCATWAGLRPLVASETEGRTADLSRRHSVTVSPSGMITVTGGKLTTYRLMASDTVDAVMRWTGRQLRRWGSPNRCRTASLRLWGAEGFEEMIEPSAARRHGVQPSVMEHLAYRYGGETPLLVASIRENPSLAEPLVDGLPYLQAEAVHAVRHEMARTLDDVLSRRVPARWLNSAAASRAAEVTAALIGPELGWDSGECARQAASFRQAVAHERSVAGLAMCEHTSREHAACEHTSCEHAACEHPADEHLTEGPQT